jgi:hypothetical protein
LLLRLLKIDFKSGLSYGNRFTDVAIYSANSLLFISNEKLVSLGWKIKISFLEGIKKLV